MAFVAGEQLFGEVMAEQLHPVRGQRFRAHVFGRGAVCLRHQPKHSGVGTDLTVQSVGPPLRGVHHFFFHLGLGETENQREQSGVSRFAETTGVTAERFERF
jgi:hypothetical protein